MLSYQTTEISDQWAIRPLSFQLLGKHTKKLPATELPEQSPSRPLTSVHRGTWPLRYPTIELADHWPISYWANYWATRQLRFQLLGQQSNKLPATELPAHWASILGQQTNKLAVTELPDHWTICTPRYQTIELPATGPTDQLTTSSCAPRPMSFQLLNYQLLSSKLQQCQLQSQYQSTVLADSSTRTEHWYWVEVDWLGHGCLCVALAVCASLMLPIWISILFSLFTSPLILLCKNRVLNSTEILASVIVPYKKLFCHQGNKKIIWICCDGLKWSSPNRIKA